MLEKEAGGKKQNKRVIILVVNIIGGANIVEAPVYPETLLYCICLNLHKYSSFTKVFRVGFG